MTCAYPNCRVVAVWTPVIELPTLRSQGMEHTMVETKRPTTLLCQPVCQGHRDTYNLADWIKTGDWAALQDLAHEKGYHIPEITLIAVQFRPLDWHPRHSLELERS